MGERRHVWIFAAAVLSAFALVASCTGYVPSDVADAGPQVDAGAPDGGEPPDSGVNDAGGNDAGSVDSGVVDAGGADAGGISDAGGGDAGTGDAGADAGSCNPVTQLGCVPADKCSLTDAGGSTCEPDGGITLGQTCGAVGIDDCAAGNQCSLVDSNFGSFCRQICLVDSDCTQPFVNSGVTLEVNNVGRCVIATGAMWGTCTYACNPVTATASGLNGCSGNLACQYSTTGSAPEETDCGGFGATPEGGFCANSSFCQTGLSCFGTVGHCRQVCRNGTNADCSVVGETCHAPPFVVGPMFGLCCPSTGC